MGSSTKQNLLPSQDYVKNNILKAEKLADEKYFPNDLKNNINKYLIFHTFHCSLK